MKLNWGGGGGGGKTRKPSVGGVWIFSGTAQCDLWTRLWPVHPDRSRLCWDQSAEYGRTG